MNFRLTAIFFGLATVLLVVLLGVVLLDTTPQALRTGSLWSPLTQKGLTAQEITQIELTRTTSTGTEKLVFQRDVGQPWRLSQPFTGKVDDGAVNSLLNDLYRAKPVRYSELTTNLTLHGLDQPSYRITLAAGDTNATLNLGLSTLGSRAVTFVTTSTDPKQPLALNRQDLFSLFRDSAAKADGEAYKLCKWLADYRVKKPLGNELRDAVGEASQLSVKMGPQGFELQRGSNPTDPWRFTNPATYGEVEEAGDSAAQSLTAAYTGLRPLLTTLTNLQTPTPDDYLEKPEPLSTYGLDPNDPNTIQIVLTAKNNTETLWLGKPVLKDGQPTVPAKVYGKLEGDQGVLQLTFDRLDSLKATIRNPGELRNKDLLPEGKRSTADALNLTVGATELKFRKVTLPNEPAPVWLLYGGPQPLRAKSSEIDGLLQVLSTPRLARSVLDTPNDAAFVPAEQKATVKVWYNGINKANPPKLEANQLPAEPALEGTPLELVIGQKLGETLAVRRLIGGQAVDLLVAETQLQNTLRSRVDWLDPRIKSFVTTNIQRLSFNRNGELYDLERALPPADAATTAGWTFVQPERLRGRAADADIVNSLLGRLSTLSANRVVLENPTTEDLKKFALEPSASRLTVTLSQKDEPNAQLTYRFGVDLNEAKTVYFQSSSAPFLLEVNKDLLTAFQSVEFRDPFPYRRSAEAITAFKMRGWRNVVGGPAPLTYEFKKSGTTWELKSPAGVSIDPAKVTELVKLLAQPRIVGFVGQPLPEHHVSIDQYPEVFEFTLEAAGQPTVALVIGNVQTNSRAFSTASTTPNEIFLLDFEPFRPLIEKPLNLQK